MSNGTATTRPRPTIEVVCRGEPREMGLAQGESLKSKISGARTALEDLLAFRAQQPRWLPFAAFRALAERRAERMLSSSLARVRPQMLDRIGGIAAGSRLAPRVLHLLNALEPFMATVRGRFEVQPGLCACSAVAVRGRRSATGEPIIARNFDYLPIVQPFFVMRESRPQRGWRSLQFTVAPLAGAVDGLNERGLCITYNYAYTIDQPQEWAPLSMVIDEALATCETVTAAAKLIESRFRWGSGLLMLADAEGDIASLEVSNSRSRLRRPAEGEDAVFHTNRFVAPDMQDVQVDRRAVFVRRVPQLLVGVRVLESAERRGERLAELMARAGALGPDELNALMSDPGPDQRPSKYTLCVHSDYWNTTGVMQYFPRTRQVRVSYSSACQAEFETFQL